MLRSSRGKALAPGLRNKWGILEPSGARCWPGRGHELDQRLPTCPPPRLSGWISFGIRGRDPSISWEVSSSSFSTMSTNRSGVGNVGSQKGYPTAGGSPEGLTTGGLRSYLGLIQAIEPVRIPSNAGGGASPSRLGSRAGPRCRMMNGSLSGLFQRESRDGHDTLPKLRPRADHADYLLPPVRVHHADRRGDGACGAPAHAGSGAGDPAASRGPARASDDAAPGARAGSTPGLLQRVVGV